MLKGYSSCCYAEGLLTPGRTAGCDACCCCCCCIVQLVRPRRWFYLVYQLQCYYDGSVLGVVSDATGQRYVHAVINATAASYAITSTVANLKLLSRPD
jgi:hypothetical protein